MLTVTGVLHIASEPEEKPYKGNSFFNFEGVSKHPRDNSNTRCYYNVSIFVPKENLDEARKKLQKKNAFQLRIGELASNKLETGTIFNKVSTSWNQIEPLKC